MVLDADGSMDPGEIDYYVAALDQGYELVKGSRALPGSGSLDLTRSDGGATMCWCRQST